MKQGVSNKGPAEACLEVALELLLHCFQASVLHVLQAVYNLQVPSQRRTILLFCVLQIPVQRLQPDCAVCEWSTSAEDPL